MCSVIKIWSGSLKMSPELKMKRREIKTILIWRNTCLNPWSLYKKKYFQISSTCLLLVCCEFGWSKADRNGQRVETCIKMFHG